MRPWAPIFALGIGCAAGNACLIELDRVIACGDGHVDELAGEECDIAVPASYLDACVGTVRQYGIGACDPDTCQLINDVQQCARCGDGIVDAEAGEECDGSNIGDLCPDGSRPACNQCRLDRSTCSTCGNGVVDLGEECDPGVGGGGDIVVPRPCAGSSIHEPLRSPYISYPYTSGSTISCLPNCEYDRTNCGYCGNGQINAEPLLVSLPPGQTESLAEECDGDRLDLEFLAAEYPACTQVGARANVACGTNCLGYVQLPGPACCLDAGEACPADGAALRCCFEYSHPEVEDVCLPVFDPGEGGGSGGGSAFQCR